MREIVARTSRRQLRTLLAVACLVLGLVTTAVLTVRSGEESAPTTPDGDAAAPVAPSASPESTGEQVSGRSAVASPDRDEYAAAISVLVFELDTRTSTPAQLRQALRQEADPGLSDGGLGDLYATIDSRVPAELLWERMRRNGQWSQWQPTRVWEPAAWAQVVTGGHAEPGWVIRNVTGVQTTHYVEGGRTQSTSRETTVSVVMRCPAEGVDLEVCRLVLIGTQPVF